MRRQINYSTAPYETRWYESALEPVVFLSNIVLAAWVYPSWSTARVQWNPGVEELIGLLESRTRTVICYGWHAHEVFTLVAFRDFPSELIPLGIGHDGLLSRAITRCGSWYGIPVWCYRRRSVVPPRHQLIEFLSEEPQIVGMFPDAGGPDGVFKPGFLEVARATHSLLVPMTMVAYPKITVGMSRKYCFPIPFSLIQVFYGLPFEAVEATLEKCQSQLEKQDVRANAARCRAK